MSLDESQTPSPYCAAVQRFSDAIDVVLERGALALRRHDELLQRQCALAAALRLPDLRALPAEPRHIIGEVIELTGALYADPPAIVARAPTATPRARPPLPHRNRI